MLQAGDKVCARKRKILKSIDATDLLQKYARRVASDAVEQYWPEAPEVVVHFLKTGEQAAEAGAAAWAAWAAAAAVAAARAARAAQAAAAWAAALAGAGEAEAEAQAAQENARKKYRKWFQEMVAVEFSRA